MTVVGTGATAAEGSLTLAEATKHVGGYKMRVEDAYTMECDSPPDDAADEAFSTPAADMWKKYPGGRRP